MMTKMQFFLKYW